MSVRNLIIGASLAALFVATLPGAKAFFHGVAATPCTSTGIFDLSNACNDIYFIGVLK